MPVVLDCSCGTRFETENRPGSTTVCPECDRPVQVPVAASGPVRTSGLAMASALLALVGLFTVVLPLIAIVLGLVALLVIRRHPDRLAGRGYALFGMVLGVIFTPLGLFAYSRAELFEGLRESLLSADVDRTGPLEVLRPEQGFAITRPSERWGIARGELAAELAGHSGSLVLAYPGRDVYVEVSQHELDAWGTMDQACTEVLNWFRPTKMPSLEQPISDYRPQSTVRLPDQPGMEFAEVRFDFRIHNNRITNLAHIIKPRHSRTFYVIRGWTGFRRYPQVEPEIRKIQASFRLLKA